MLYHSRCNDDAIFLQLGDVASLHYPDTITLPLRTCRCPMYKNPTDWFMHVTSGKSAAATLADQFSDQVMHLQDCICSPHHGYASGLHSALQTRVAYHSTYFNAWSMQRRETDAASQLEAGGEQVPADDSSQPHATGTTMVVANLPVTAPLWYQVLSTPNVPM